MTVRSSSNLQVINLDGVFTTPALDLHNYIKLLGIAGLSEVYFKSKTDYMDGEAHRTNIATNSKKNIRLGLDVGAGVETKIINNVALRATAKYTRVLNMGYFNDFMSYNLALKYDF